MRLFAGVIQQMAQELDVLVPAVERPEGHQESSGENTPTGTRR
jgi:hypothetical protein